MTIDVVRGPRGRPQAYSPERGTLGMIVGSHDVGKQSSRLFAGIFLLFRPWHTTRETEYPFF